MICLKFNNKLVDIRMQLISSGLNIGLRIPTAILGCDQCFAKVEC